MSVPFVERTPTDAEIERLRLILSTYQDGSGMLQRDEGFTLPGWRDFERSVAAAFSGKALESKWIYDVILTNPEGVQFGVSCKMRGMLREVERKGRVTIELSNASGEFWDSVKRQGITQENYHNHPEIVGATIIEVVEGWHENVGLDNGGFIDHFRSFLLSLQWEPKTGRYQLFQYPVDLPDPGELVWEVVGRRLIGRDQKGVLFEWYGLSGGQLKYYPLAGLADWQSSVFYLEPLPDDLEYGLQRKAELYFSDIWPGD